MSIFQNGTQSNAPRLTDEIAGETGPAPVSSGSSGSTPAPFINGTSGAANSTQVHKYPLPPEGRGYRPTYSGGRYLLPSPTGKPGMDKFTRVTTGAKALDDTAGLDKWKLRNVVLGLKDTPDLLDGIDMFAEPREVTNQLNRVADKAQELAGAKQASELGTAIHAWTEAVERDGVPLGNVPDQFHPYVSAYLKSLADAGIATVPGLVERIVYHSGTGWVGTFDRIYQLADGTRVIGDVKTSKTLRYGLLGFSMQLATYADADYMLSLDGQSWEPMPAIGNIFAVIAHVPSNNPGQCELVTVDLEAGRDAIALAEDVRGARSAGQSGTIKNNWDLPPRADTGLESQVKQARSAEDLSALWAANQDVWTDELTQLGYDVIAGQVQ